VVSSIPSRVVVEVKDIADPKFEDPHGRKINHAVILKIVSTNICGSDQHMVRGRTTAPAGLVLGHEITGEVIEKGADVEFLEVGDMDELAERLDAMRNEKLMLTVNGRQQASSAPPWCPSSRGSDERRIGRPLVTISMAWRSTSRSYGFPGRCLRPEK
jgi:hypothetical protein